MKKILSVILVLAMMISCIPAHAEMIEIDASIYSEEITELEGKAETISSLISQCEEKGLEPDYEIMRGAVVERYTESLKSEIENGISYRTEENGYTQSGVMEQYSYNINSLNEIADEAISNLNAYLNGTKKPMQVPDILTSQTEIDGRGVSAITELDGVSERNNVFLNGFGHYTAYENYEFFKKTGANLIQTEIGMSTYAKPANGISDWVTGYNLKPDATISLSEEEARSGDKSLKMTNNTEITNGYYMNLTQSVKVQPRTSYTLSFYAKGSNITNFVYKTTASGTFRRITYSDAVTLNDWTKYELTFITDSGQKTDKIYLSTEGITEAIYIDDVTFCKTGTTDNLLKNTGFEETDPEDKVIDADYKTLWDLAYRFEEAQKNNVKVDLLLAPHYFVWTLAQKYPDILEGGTCMGFRIGHEAAEAACKFHAQVMAEFANEFDCINSICMANEPSSNSKDGGNDSFYMKDYTLFLESEYGTIENYNAICNTQYDEFSDIPMASAGIGGGRSIHTYNYTKFNDDIGTAWVKMMSEAIGEVSDIPVHVKMMPYVSSTEDDDKRWLIGVGFDPQKYSDYVDINGNDGGLLIPANYTGDISAYMEQRLLQQSMWYDFLSSIKTAPVFNSEDHILANGGKTYLKEHNKLINATQWMGALHGRTMVTTWIFDRNESRPETYESIAYRPDLYENMAEINMDLNRLADEAYAVMEEPFNIGIFYSDTTRNYTYMHMNAMYKAYEQCLYNGLRPGFVVETQLEKLNNYDVVIIPYVICVTPKTLQALKAYVDGGGKIITIGDNALKYNQHMQENNSSDVSAVTDGAVNVSMTEQTLYVAGISEDELYNAIYEETKDLNLSEVEIIDNATGERVRDVEYSAADYNGSKIINICNYNWDNDKNVSIYINGEKVTKARELRSGEMLTDNITLLSCTPVLIRVGNFNTSVTKENMSGNTIEYAVTAGEELKDVELITAVYNPDGTLSQVDIEEFVRIKDGTKKSCTVTLDELTEYNTVKTMLMDLNMLKPYADELVVQTGIVTTPVPTAPPVNSYVSDFTNEDEVSKWTRVVGETVPTVADGVLTWDNGNTETCYLLPTDKLENFVMDIDLTHTNRNYNFAMMFASDGTAENIQKNKIAINVKNTRARLYSEYMVGDRDITYASRDTGDANGYQWLGTAYTMDDLPSMLSQSIKIRFAIYNKRLAVWMNDQLIYSYTLSDEYSGGYVGVQSDYFNSIIRSISVREATSDDVVFAESFNEAGIVGYTELTAANKLMTANWGTGSFAKNGALMTWIDKNKTSVGDHVYSAGYTLGSTNNGATRYLTHMFGVKDNADGTKSGYAVYPKLNGVIEVDRITISASGGITVNKCLSTQSAANTIAKFPDKLGDIGGTKVLALDTMWEYRHVLKDGKLYIYLDDVLVHTVESEEFVGLEGYTGFFVSGMNSTLHYFSVRGAEDGDIERPATVKLTQSGNVLSNKVVRVYEGETLYGTSYTDTNGCFDMELGHNREYTIKVYNSGSEDEIATGDITYIKDLHTLDVNLQ